MSTPILVIAPSRHYSFADLILRLRGRNCAPHVVHSSPCRKLAQRFQGRRPKCLHQVLGCIHWRDKVSDGFHSPQFTQVLLKYHWVSAPLSLLMLEFHTLFLVGYHNASRADKRPALTRARSRNSGHSERRTLFHETSELVAQKTKAAIDIGLSVILCIGETLAEREAGKCTQVIETQLQAVVQLTQEADWGCAYYQW